MPTLAFEKQKLGPKKPSKKALIQEKRVHIENSSLPTSFYIRSKLRPGNQFNGPAIILEYSSTLFIPADFNVQVDAWSNLIVEPLQIN